MVLDVARLGWLLVVWLVSDIEQDLEQRLGVHLGLHQALDLDGHLKWSVPRTGGSRTRHVCLTDGPGGGGFIQLGRARPACCGSGGQRSVILRR